jgi:hypothetical protein
MATARIARAAVCALLGLLSLDPRLSAQARGDGGQAAPGDGGDSPALPAWAVLPAWAEGACLGAEGSSIPEPVEPYLLLWNARWLARVAPALRIVELNRLEADFGDPALTARLLERGTDRHRCVLGVFAGLVTEIRDLREGGSVLLVSDEPGGARPLLVYSLLPPDAQIVRGARVRAWAVVQGESTWETMAGRTVRAPWTIALHVGLAREPRTATPAQRAAFDVGRDRREAPQMAEMRALVHAVLGR